MKKLLAWILAVFMLASLGTAAFAAEGVDVLPTEEEEAAEGTFYYYEIQEVSVQGESIDIGEDPAYLVVLSDGLAVMSGNGSFVSLEIDLDTGLITVETGDTADAVIEDGMLTIIDNASGGTIVSAAADPDEALKEWSESEEEGFADGTFRYYELDRIVSEDGYEDDGGDEPAFIILFSDGRGFMSIYGETVAIQFDFDEMTFDCELDTGTFDLTDEGLTIYDSYGTAGKFVTALPGSAGSLDGSVAGTASYRYFKVESITDDKGELTDYNELMYIILYADDTALLSSEDSAGGLRLQLDFDTMTVNSDEGEMGTFTLEDDVFTIIDVDGYVGVFVETAGPSGGGETEPVSFRYFEMVSLEDEEGNPVDNGDDIMYMILYSDDTGVLSVVDSDDALNFEFDFDDMTLTSEYGEEGSFTLEDDVLTIIDSEGYVGVFVEADPDLAGVTGGKTADDASFRYFKVESVVDENGEDSDSGDPLYVILYPDNTGVLSAVGSSQEILFEFDFDTMTLTSDDGDMGSFTLEDNVLTIVDPGGYVGTFIEVDPADAEF